MAKDYYKILGVDKNACADDVKKAFKKLAMQHHPDRQGGDEKKFKEINEAYQVLGDAEKRKRYDQFGSDFEQQGGFGGGVNWEDFMQQARGGGFSGNFGGVDLGDIFGEMFGFGAASARHGRASAAKGRDIQVDIEVDFKEAAFGVEREISLPKQEKCDVCKGDGAEPGSAVDTCHTCKGQGQVVQMQRTFLGSVQSVATCPDCHGRGKRASKKCKHCGGDGILAKTSNIKIKIPAGIDDGQSIRLEGRGEAAPHGGQSGDLYVRVHARPLKGMTRDGYNIYTEAEISYPQAVLGDKIDVETLDGPVKLVIPEGTESGQLIRLRDRGVPYLEGRGRGDQYVKIKIRVPKKLNRDARRRLEELKNDL